MISPDSDPHTKQEPESFESLLGDPQDAAPDDPALKPSESPSAESTHFGESGETLASLPAWTPQPSCWLYNGSPFAMQSDPSIYYRWADGSALVRARSERIYKPGNKQEWRAVYWLLVPSFEADDVRMHRSTMRTHCSSALTPKELVLRKHRRRQCSFSCLKYGEEGAQQRARTVLDFISVTGFLPPNLKGSPNGGGRRRRKASEVVRSETDLAAFDSSSESMIPPAIFGKSIMMSAPPNVGPYERLPSLESLASESSAGERPYGPVRNSQLMSA